MKKLLLLLFLSAHLFLSAQYPNLIPYRNGNLWGYCDSAKKIIIPCKFDSAGKFTTNYLSTNNFTAQVIFNGTKKTLLANGEFTSDAVVTVNPILSIATDYQITPSFNYWVRNGINIAPVFLYRSGAAYNAPKFPPVKFQGPDGKYGYQNYYYYTTVIPCKFSEAEDFSEGLAVVRLNDSISGYINEKGRFVARYKYAKQLNSFSNGQATVWLKNGMGVIDGTGKFIIPANAIDIVEVDSYYAVHNSDSSYSLMNKSGTLADQRKFDLIEQCPNELIKVVYKGKVNYLNKYGKAISKIWFAQTMPFNYSQYIAVANEEGKWGFINEYGKIMIPLKYEKPDSQLFQENLCRMGNQGYIDSNGKEYWEN